MSQPIFTVNATTAICENYGQFGLLVDNRQDFDPAVGMTFAHDCLEHINSDSDNIIDGECVALGTMLRTRYVAGYGNLTKDSMVDLIAYELEAMLPAHMYDEGIPFAYEHDKHVDTVMANIDNLPNDVLKFYTQLANTEAMATVLEDYEMWLEDMEEYDSTKLKEDFTFMLKQIAFAVMYGYICTDELLNKWGICAWQFTQVFKDIEKQANDLLKEYDDIEGIDVIFYIDLTKGAYYEVVYDWDEDEDLID